MSFIYVVIGLECRFGWGTGQLVAAQRGVAAQVRVAAQRGGVAT